MKGAFAWAVFASGLCAAACAKPAAVATFHGQTFPKTLFRPEAPVADALARAVDASTGSVQAALYELNSPPLVAALLRARRRGVQVSLVLDEGARRSKRELRALAKSGARLHFLKGAPPYGAMHAKFAVYDGALLSDGSYNWTKNSESLHYENEEFIDDPALVSAFSLYWESLWNSAQAPVVAGSVRFHGTALPACAFSPYGGGAEEVEKALKLTRDTADVAMFSFYSYPIAAALARAGSHGVRVRLLLDQDQAADEPALRYLAGKRVEIRLCSGPGGPGAHSRMHHKFAVLDGRLLENGSFNFTANADKRNFETLRFSSDADEAGAFEKEFERLWSAARPAS